ncbi:MAG TPA: substrate-binding domain-containing protein, partial [Bifidobacterium pullorum]|nr:substrate-binding domain-containing protein [Bifidobacterium pullorum]
DLSITGFDDSDFAEEVGLTTVRQRPRDMAATAARMALDLIDGKTLETPHITAPVQLMLRHSTAAPRA